MRREYWRAADRALGTLEKRGGALFDLGAEVLEGFLERWGTGETEAALAFLRTEADADRLIESMAAGTEKLEGDTERRRKRDEALVGLARELGHGGARLLLGLLFA